MINKFLFILFKNDKENNNIKTQKTQMQKFITYQEFDAKKLTGGEPKTETIKKDTGDVTYNEIKFLYNYGTTEEPVLAELFVELPELPMTGVIAKQGDMATGKNGPYQKMNYSTKVTFDLCNPSNRKEVEIALLKIHEIYMATSQILGQYKGKLKMPHFNPLMPEVLYKDPIYWPMDDKGEKMEGRDPSMYLKLRNYGHAKTLFTDLKGGVQDWKVLNNVEMRGVPLLHIEKIHVGTKPSLQVYCSSTIITEIRAVGSQTKQISTLERLKAKYGNTGVESVEAQLAELKMARQETLTSETTHHPANMQDVESLQDFLGSSPSASSHTNTQSTLNTSSANPTTEKTTSSIKMPNISTSKPLQIPIKLN